MKVLMFSDSEIWDIMTVLASLLHLGNIKYNGEYNITSTVVPLLESSVSGTMMTTTSRNDMPIVHYLLLSTHSTLRPFVAHAVLRFA